MKSDRERDDNYKWITRNINDRYRLIVYTYATCLGAPGSAFALQYKGGKNNWKGRKYFVTIERANKVIKDMGLE